ncbi:phosphate acetyltransferase [Candidatus Woesearchaeota archaeon]|nr:phosphate acetyltransferase [Candidatus Woesearchaeota archaeon]
MEKLLRRLEQKARKNPQRIVFPESAEPRTLEAIRHVLREGYASVILLGEENVIGRALQQHRISRKKVTIVNPRTAPEREGYASTYYQLRKDKGMTPGLARRLMQEGIYFGTMMVRKGKADGLIYGAIHPTPETFRPALHMLRDKGKLVSTFFVMKHRHDFYFFADAALNVQPTEQELASIAITTADTARKLLGWKKPSVALLSFSTHGSTKHPLTEKVRKATLLARRKRPDLVIDGELQADAALLPEVYKIKCHEKMLHGPANILVFPDLQSANIAYKLLEWLGHYQAIGPITQGLKKPVNDLSRGCTVQDIIDVTVITVCQAQETRKRKG